MRLAPFLYAPMEAFKRAELVKRYEDDVTPEPQADMVVGERAPPPDLARVGDAYLDRYGNLMTYEGIVGKGRFLYKLHDVTVIHGGPLGPHAWHIFMEPNICAVEVCPRGNRDLIGTEGITFDGIGDAPVSVNVLPDFGEPYRETQPSIFYGSDFDNNYFHRVFDLLPRAWAETEGLIPEGARWHHADKPTVRYDTLYFPSWWPALGYAPGPVEWLRAQPRVDGNTCPTCPDILYLTRAGTKKRRVLNEADVLRSCGRATMLSMSDRTLQEQQALVRRAKIIVAPHGAALSNVVWADRCAVIEMVPEQWQHPVYQYISKWSGHWYGRMICKTDEPDTSVVEIVPPWPMPPPTHDMTVDIEAFAAMLAEARKEIGL